MTNERSQNGWPASKDPAEINIKSFSVAGTKIKLRCQAQAGRILSAFAAEFHATVEPIDEKKLDDWGYAYRNVRGSVDNLSNHASGTAIDINAVQHPLGKSDTFTPEQQSTIRLLCKKYALRWGGDYTSRKDDMHFEINTSPAKVKRLADEMGLPQ